MKLNRSNKGFTLVEIMIVVVIIGLLAAMAVPAFEKVRRNSIAKAMINDARQLGGAFQQVALNRPNLNANITVDYNATSGRLTTTANNGTPENELVGYVSQLSKGYGQNAITFVYNVTTPTANDGSYVAANHSLFTLRSATCSPKDVVVTSTNDTKNTPVDFSAEGKPLGPL